MLFKNQQTTAITRCIIINKVQLYWLTVVFCFVNFACLYTVQDKYIQRLATAMEAVFLEKSGVHPSVVADVHHYIYKRTGQYNMNITCFIHHYSLARAFSSVMSTLWQLVKKYSIMYWTSQRECKKNIVLQVCDVQHFQSLLIIGLTNDNPSEKEGGFQKVYEFGR